METGATSAAGGALQLVLQMQQGLVASVASMGAGNPVLAAGQQLAAMDAGGSAAGLAGVSNSAVQAVDTYS